MSGWKWTAAVAGLAAVAAASLWWWQAEPGSSVQAAVSSDSQRRDGVHSPFQGGALAGLLSAAARGEPVQPGALDVRSLPREQQIAVWQARYERAEQVLAVYRDATRYPPESRPMADAPDQVRPFDPIVEDKPMRDEQGEPVKGISLRTTQDRVFMSGADSVRLTVQAFDEKGQVLPLVVTRAAVQNMPEGNQLTQVRQVSVEFGDAGGTVDQIAGDGIYSAVLTPASQGYAAARGTLRTLVFVRANGYDGVARFDVVYTPEVPATWAQGPGAIRDAVENGSLNVYLKANVAVAGRYVISGRIDDANGVPFAHVSFNDERGVGQQEFRLHVFGALINDTRPAFPLRLRDVDGFLLIPNASPDRAMMARRPGVIHTTGSYTLAQFSSSEWTSEERTRYLTEYGGDVDDARKELSLLGVGPR